MKNKKIILIVKICVFAAIFLNFGLSMLQSVNALNDNPSHIDYDEYIQDLIVNDDFFYVCTNHKIHIGKISDSLTKQSSIILPDIPLKVSINNNYLFVTTFEGLVPCFRCYDVLDPTNPSCISSLELPFFGRNIIINNDYAYLFIDSCSPSKIIVIDISDVLNMNIISNVNDINISNCVGLDIEDDLLYMIGTDKSDPLLIYNVTEPDNVTFVKSILFHNKQCNDFKIKYDILYFASEKGLDIYNISDLNNPIMLCESFIGDRIYSIDFSENFLIVSGDSSGVYLIDINQYQNPEIKGKYSFSSFVFQKIIVSGNAIIACNNMHGVFLLEIDDILNAYSTDNWIFYISIGALISGFIFLIAKFSKIPRNQKDFSSKSLRNVRIRKLSNLFSISKKINITLIAGILDLPKEELRNFLQKNSESLTNFQILNDLIIIENHSDMSDFIYMLDKEFESWENKGDLKLNKKI